MAVTTDQEQLPCSAELESLVAQVADNQPPPDPAHQTDCPYCQAALRTLHQGWEDVQMLTQQPVPIPPALTAQIMARVRTLARQATRYILLGHPRGDTRISHTLIAKAIQHVASTVPSVVFASARPIPHEPPQPGRISVAIRLVVTFGPAVETTAHAVRQIIHRHIPTITGAQLSRIDITIDDIAEPTD